MKSGDIVFYVLIAFSVLKFFSKAMKKNEVSEEDEKPSSRNIIREIMQEFHPKDDFIPKNSQKVPPLITTSSDSKKMSKNMEDAYFVPEVEQRAKEYSSHLAKNLENIQTEEPENEFLNALDLSNQDEFKKAIVYSEILKTKF